MTLDDLELVRSNSDHDMIISCSNTSWAAVEIISLTAAKKLYRSVMPKLVRRRLISMRLICNYSFSEDSNQSRQCSIILANVTTKCRYGNRFGVIVHRGFGTQVQISIAIIPSTLAMFFCSSSVTRQRSSCSTNCWKMTENWRNLTSEFAPRTLPVFSVTSTLVTVIAVFSRR